MSKLCISVLVIAAVAPCCQAFNAQPSLSRSNKRTALDGYSRREMIIGTGTVGLVNLISCQKSQASEFTPGGTLVDRDVGILVGNPEASPSRRFDNTNVLFAQDHFFKFGVAAPWVPPGSTDFPKSMPFVISQQRYDNLKKYGGRIDRGVEYLVGVKDTIKGGDYSQILPPDAPEYQLRPMGLLANGMLASENTGATNELFLARYYVNEIYLSISDIRSAKGEAEAMQRYQAMLKAIDSFYGLMNRVITPKVGEQFKLLAAS